MGNRQRRRPRLVQAQQHVRALAQPNRRQCRGVLESPHDVDPWPGRVDDRSRGDLNRVSVGVHDGTRDSPVHCSQLANLRVVEDDGARLLGGAQVREAEPPVVRRRVGVDAARAEAVEAEARDALASALGRSQAVESRACECAVEDEPGLDRRRTVRAVPVERKQER